LETVKGNDEQGREKNHLVADRWLFIRVWQGFCPQQPYERVVLAVFSMLIEHDRRIRIGRGRDFRVK
jgi:hypothetical protein